MIVPVSYEPTLLAWDYNFFPFNDILSDPAVDADPIACYKFVSLENSSRVLIKIDRDEMSP